MQTSKDFVDETVDKTLQIAADLVSGLAKLEDSPYGCSPYAKKRLEEAAESIERLIGKKPT